jgi:hypothetical protein
VIVYIVCVFEDYRGSLYIFLGYIFDGKSSAIILTNMGWAMYTLGVFLQTHLVTLPPIHNIGRISAGKNSPYFFKHASSRLAPSKDFYGKGVAIEETAKD